MIYRRSPRFRQSQAALPDSVQGKLLKAFRCFRENPQHPSLQVHRLHCREGLYAGRVDRQHRFTFEYRRQIDGTVVCWFIDVGRHDILDVPKE